MEDPNCRAKANFFVIQFILGPQKNVNYLDSSQEKTIHIFNQSSLKSFIHCNIKPHPKNQNQPKLFNFNHKMNTFNSKSIILVLINTNATSNTHKPNFSNWTFILWAENKVRHTQNGREFQQSLGRRRRGFSREREDTLAVVIQSLNLGALAPHA